MSRSRKFFAWDVCPTKSAISTIEARAVLLERGLPVRLTLIGYGPKRVELQALAERIGVADRVRFAGSVGHDDILPMFRSADIFCLPIVLRGHTSGADGSDGSRGPSRGGPR